MALRDPVAVYNAENNLEAALVCEALQSAGLEAFAVEDDSVVGMTPLGFLPEIHKPQVWVERADVERAKRLLEKYEQDAAARRAEVDQGAPIPAVCEECGKESTYPAARRGFVEECPHCGAYVDVGDDADFGPWDAESGADVEGV